MKKNVYHLVVSVASIGLLAGTTYATGTKTPAKTGVVEDAQTKIYDIMDKDVTTVSFKKGSTEVTESERTDLRALVRSVQNDTKIDQIVVAAWSDNDLPTTGRKDLSAADQTLANARADNVKKVLAELGAPGIKTYSMATSPSWITEVFGTKQANVKNSVKGNTVNDQAASEVAQTLKSKGGPSTVVVLVKRQHNT